MGEIYAAKTNHITNPAGYALKPLVFSWKVKGCKGQEQRHARIMISKEPTFTTLFFDTGEAALDSRAARVEFDPQPCTRYYWKVLVATDAAETIESDVQFFETAKMEEPWTAQWITCDSSQQRHPIFCTRKAVYLRSGIVRSIFSGGNQQSIEQNRRRVFNAVL